MTLGESKFGDGSLHDLRQRFFFFLSSSAFIPIHDIPTKALSGRVSVVAIAISLLPRVRSHSRSTLGVNRGQVWFQDVDSFGVLFRLNNTTPWFSISSNQQQRVFVYKERLLLVRQCDWGIIILWVRLPTCTF
ncbi:predicted protein [Lichtheimia corymbifera JMRC:FSU:9682]|uniref:Uncharacterized protein n=1 Tax=Lichtheimia corymbifera JMRC:FSU:9682 TaxID=1263082 RepID=A0A068RTV7_9FUNG|nr:predicted protein [Lichtheimia corymbifera JMRC:FSU:9682]